jgi:hypothetical protein
METEETEIIPRRNTAFGSDATSSNMSSSMDRHRYKFRTATRSVSSKYRTKIIKAGALLADTKILLSHWDLNATVQANLESIRLLNIFGKASRSRVADILAVFRQRYLSEESVVKALVRLAKSQMERQSLDRILYFHSAQSDQLLYDTVVEALLPLRSQGVVDVGVNDIQRVLGRWVREGKTTSAWGDYTLLRVAQGLLSTLRDFGILEGAVNKQISPVYLPLPAFAYIAFYLKQHQPSGHRLLDLSEWKLFFLSHEGVERLFIEAHQHHLLEYHAAGSVTRITFPANSLEGYADVLVKRTD